MSFVKQCITIVIWVFCLKFQMVVAQDQRIADSLFKIYEVDTLKGLQKLKLLDDLSFNEVNDYSKKLAYSEELISLAKENGNYDYLYFGLVRKGDAQQFVGDLEEALASYFKSAQVAKQEKFISREGGSYGAIADIYSISNNHKNAMLYYKKAIASLRNTSDTLALASVILNAGDELFRNKEYDAAILNFNESGALFESVNYDVGKAYTLGNIGMVYANTGKNDLAEKNINEAIRILQESQDYNPVSVYLMSMADIYLEKEEHQTAINYAHKSLSLAKEFGLKEQIVDANLKLSQLYELIGELVVSYKHYKDHIVYRDSLINIKTVQNLAEQRSDFEVSQKQIEVNLLEQKRKNQRIVVIATGIALFLIGLLAILLYRRYVFVRKTKQIIEEERDRSDRLLLNILPEETAAELKQNGVVKAKKYEAVTVLFSDFKGFTAYSEKLSPETLVETVGFYFSRFDEIMEKYGLEKIKTIGDAYMCAGGLHQQTADHAHKMVSAALEIVHFVEETKNDVAANAMSFDIRIGINTGPVVAGVVGTKKFAYDIWGDTVNVAARMETLSDPGKINVSEATYELIKDSWNCTYRGEIEVKNRGALKMYFVDTGV